jgi:hypothetical protein
MIGVYSNYGDSHVVNKLFIYTTESNTKWTPQSRTYPKSSILSMITMIKTKYNLPLNSNSRVPTPNKSP